ncbi:hypothetical protein [Agromyces neolithicus]|uniref:hypothetical protein n=1 Tax=Agromyces neolithicus TaxID=269420 RepID=UPI0031D26545
MAKTLSKDELVERARAFEADRINAIHVLADAHQNITNVREAAERELAEVARQTAARVADAEGDEVRAYSAAIAAGWTPDALRKIGFGEPDKKARVRRKSARKSAATSPAAASGSEATASDQ